MAGGWRVFIFAGVLLFQCSSPARREGRERKEEPEPAPTKTADAKKGNTKTAGGKAAAGKAVAAKKAGKGNKNAGKKGEEKAAGEVVNRVRYVVGDIAITELDIEQMKGTLKYLQKARLVPEDARDPVEELIKRAIVRLEATKESLLVTDARIEHEISRRKEAAGVTSDEEFQKLVEKQAGMPYRVWLEDMPYQIQKRQIIQLKVQAAPPTKEELESFYRKNRDKVGMEVAWREIVFVPRSAADERRIASVARDVHTSLSRNPRSFARVAQTHPENRSRLAAAGGYNGYEPLHELARNNNRLAGMLYQMGAGQVSPVFVEAGRYYIIQLVGRRPTPFENVRRLIQGRVMLEKEEQEFHRWIERQKKEIAIVEIK